MTVGLTCAPPNLSCWTKLQNSPLFTNHNPTANPLPSTLQIVTPSVRSFDRVALLSQIGPQITLLRLVRWFDDRCPLTLEMGSIGTDQTVEDLVNRELWTADPVKASNRAKARYWTPELHTGRQWATLVEGTSMAIICLPQTVLQMKEGGCTATPTW